MKAFPAAAAVLMLALCGQMVTIEAEDKCQQPKEVGRCRGYFPKYFYNSESGTCEQFVYGGCGGNDNRFDTVEQCQAACAQKDKCQQPKEAGRCRGYFPKYFYNSESGTCEQFVYGGCDGNDNRFDTVEQCQAACAQKDKCQQPKEVGRCRGYFPKYFYNSESGTCEQFVYGGCDGNDNRFDTVEQCQAACAQNNVCQLPKQRGMCLAYMPKFYYNTETETCEEFIYGGCGGNGNKFDTKEKCQAACVKDVCQLPKQQGMCLAYIPKFYYNNETGACEEFIYGGCGGNGNQFDTKEQCQAACA